MPNKFTPLDEHEELKQAVGVTLIASRIYLDALTEFARFMYNKSSWPEVKEVFARHEAILEQLGLPNVIEAEKRDKQ